MGSSPRCYLFTSTTGRIGVYKLSPKYGTKPIRFVTLHFQKTARRSFASSKKSRSHSHSCPIRYDFHGRAKAIQYNVNIASDSYPVTIYKSDEKREDWMIIEARGDLWEDNSVPPNLNLLPAKKHKNSELGKSLRALAWREPARSKLAIFYG